MITGVSVTILIGENIYFSVIYELLSSKDDWTKGSNLQAVGAETLIPFVYSIVLRLFLCYSGTQ